MFLIKKLLTALILPPTGPVLLALLGLWLASRANRRIRYAGFLLAATSLLVLLALSVAVIARVLPIEKINTPISPEALANTQAIVILGAGIYADAPEYGGDTLAGAGLERVRYGAKLARDSHLPVLTTGGAPFGGTPEGEVMKSVLETDFRVSVRWVEAESRDTVENARLSAIILKRAGIARIALVSHASHLPRAIPLFEREGLTVTPAPTLVSRPGTKALELNDFLPGIGALNHSYTALYESLGRLANRISEMVNSHG